MEQRLEELRALAEAARAKKGRMDAQSRSRAADLIGEIWTSSSELAGETPRLLEDLTPEAVADAVCKMWPALTNVRRQEFKRTLHRPTSEKGTRRLALLIAAVMRSDGPTAFEWLQVLLPREKERPSKEAQRAIAAILFSSPPLPFAELATASDDGIEILRIFSAIWEISRSSPSGSSLMARVKLATAFVHVAERYPENDLSSKFLKGLLEEKQQWPSHISELVNTELTQLTDSKSAWSESVEPQSANDSAVQAHTLAGSESISNPTAVASMVQEKSDSVHPFKASDVLFEIQYSSEAGDSKDVLHSLKESARKDLLALQSIESFLARLTTELTASSHRIDMLESEMGAAKARFETVTNESESTITHLRDELRDVNRRLHDTERSLAGERELYTERAAELKQEIEKRELEWRKEKESLYRQIGVNADGRVDEFRKSLGAKLSRFAKDLPAKSSDMSNELGIAVLFLFHQFVEAAQELGVPISIGNDKR